jgi:hypothetical protein
VIESGEFPVILSNIDTARTIEGGIGHDLPQEAPGAFADAMLKAGRS